MNEPNTTDLVLSTTPQFPSGGAILGGKAGRQREKEILLSCGITEDLGNNILLDMVGIPGGTFQMGSPEGEGEKTEQLYGVTRKL